MHKRHLMGLAVFFLLFWLAVLLSSMMVHEIGHAMTGMIAGGWHNSVARFGQTDFTDPGFELAAVQKAQAGGVSPAEWGIPQQLELITDLARQEAPFRYAILGGWIAQLLAAGIVFLIYRTQGFHAQASSFSRAFWGAFLLFNPAWLGGTWLLYGAWTLQSTDPVVLVNVILQGNPIALCALWIVSIGLIGLALALAHRYGYRIFLALEYSGKGGRRMALLWTGAVALTGFAVKLPAIAAMLIAFPLMIAVPLWETWRLVKMGEAPPRISGYVWSGISIILIGIILLAATNSGILIGGDTGIWAKQAVQSYYCEKVNCVPEDVLQWITP